MAHDNESWDNLPSVILLEVFSYLNPKDRIQASSVCKNWRQALFHPSFWKNITFVFNDTDIITWSRHLTDCFALSVQSTTVECQTPHCSLELERLLRSLRDNRNLKHLFIEPTSSTLEWSVIEHDYSTDTWTHPIFNSLIIIIETSKRLESLTLGCIEELALKANSIVERLAQYHGKHLTHLGLASVKEEPEAYMHIFMDRGLFQQFERLCVLTLDYDYLNDKLLRSLTCGTLEKLVVHVHKWDSCHAGTSDSAWTDFTSKNPRCTLRLSLLHAYTAITVLVREILRPAMPLTHFKALFCEYVDFSVFYRLFAWYSQTLRSIVWIDSLDSYELIPPTHDLYNPDNPDALVLLAWQCHHLEELIYIGHLYYLHNLLAIARLRGSALQMLRFAESNLIRENYTVYRRDEIYQELSNIFGDKWKAYSDAELTPVLRDAVKGDSRDIIMPFVLKDAK